MLPSVAFCCVALWSRKDTTTATVRQSRDMWGWGRYPDLSTNAAFGCTCCAPTCIVYRCPWPIAAGEHEVRPYMHCLSVSMTCNLPRCLPMCSRGMTNGHYANHKHPLRAGYPLGAVAPGRSEGAETVRPVSAQKGIGISSDERFLQKRMHMNGFCEQVAHPWTIIGSP